MGASGIGALVGVLIAAVDYFLLRLLASRVDLEETKSVLNITGLSQFVLKLCFVFFMFAMVKAFVPRYRYDQLMRLGWKVFLPLSLFMVVATAAFLKITGFA